MGLGMDTQINGGNSLMGHKSLIILELSNKAIQQLYQETQSVETCSCTILEIMINQTLAINSEPSF